MAEKIGEIIGRQNGANYSLADVYENKGEGIPKNLRTDQYGYYFLPPDITMCQETVLEDRVFTYQTNYNVYYGSRTTVTPTITTEHAKFDYALQLDGGKCFNTGNGFYNLRYNQNFSLFGHCFIDVEPETNFEITFAQFYGSGSNKNVVCYVKLGYELSKARAFVEGHWDTTYTNRQYILDYPFNDIFHFAVTFNATYIKTYINYKEISSITGVGTKFLNEYNSSIPGGTSLQQLIIGDSKNTKDIYLSELILNRKKALTSTELQSYTGSAIWEESSNNVIYFPIRHNGTNKYIPLTSDKGNTTTPCLAARHNGANYYAIK